MKLELSFFFLLFSNLVQFHNLLYRTFFSRNRIFSSVSNSYKQTDITTNKSGRRRGRIVSDLFTNGTDSNVSWKISNHRHWSMQRSRGNLFHWTHSLKKNKNNFCLSSSPLQLVLVLSTPRYRENSTILWIDKQTRQSEGHTYVRMFKFCFFLHHKRKNSLQKVHSRKQKLGKHSPHPKRFKTL